MARASPRPPLGCSPGAILPAVEIRIELDRLALQMVQRQSHRRKRRRADGDAVLDALGIIHRPLQRLHAADGRADYDVQSLHAELVEHLRLRAHDVANASPAENPARKAGRLPD